MKKVWISVFLILLLPFLCSVRTNAYYLMPSDTAVEFSSPDLIPNYLDRFGGGKKIQRQTYSSIVTSEDSFVVYEANQPVCLPLEIFTESIWLSKGTFTYQYTYGESKTTTYEEKLIETVGIHVGYQIGSSVGIPNLLELSSELSSEIESSLSSAVTTTHSYTVDQGFSITVETMIEESGIYAVERRGIFKCYLIQKNTTIYDVKLINGLYRRLGGKRYFMLENQLRFVLLNDQSFITLAKYNLNSKGEFEVDASYFNLPANIVVL